LDNISLDSDDIRTIERFENNYYNHKNNVLQNGGSNKLEKNIERLFNCYVLSLNQNGGKDNKISSLIKKKLDKKLKNNLEGGLIDPVTAGATAAAAYFVSHSIGTTVNEIVRIIAKIEEEEKAHKNNGKPYNKNDRIKIEITEVLEKYLINLPNGIINLLNPSNYFPFQASLPPPQLSQPAEQKAPQPPPRLQKAPQPPQRLSQLQIQPPPQPYQDPPQELLIQSQSQSQLEPHQKLSPRQFITQRTFLPPPRQFTSQPLQNTLLPQQTFLPPRQFTSPTRYGKISV
jgi:hypothetical protein